MNVISTPVPATCSTGSVTSCASGNANTPARAVVSSVPCEGCELVVSTRVGGLGAREGASYQHGLLHEEVEVGPVVEDLLRLPADAQHRGDGLQGVVPPQRLCPQHDAVHPIQHRVGNVRGLSPA